MTLNMKKWIENLRSAKIKKALPILSFPSAQILGVTVKELIADSTLQAKGMKLIAERTNSAAAVSLMDLSVEAECFGANVIFSETEVPTVTGRMVNGEDDAESLQIPKVGTARSGLYIESVRKAVSLITDRPVFAGMIGPFSLAARLLDVTEIMLDCYDDPDTVHIVLKKVTEFLINYAKAYKDAGANGIILAEPVSGLLSPTLEKEFSSPYVKNIVDAVQDDSFILIYHNCGDNTPMMTESILTTGSAAYHFGNSVNMKNMLEKFPQNIPIMGNIDPASVLRNGTPEKVREETFRIMEECSEYENFVISSGCDIPPLTPWANIDAFFSAVEEFYEN